MDPAIDPRTRMLIEMAKDRFPRELLEWLLHNFDTLEQTDFGELEPAGIGAPTAIGSHK